MMIADSDKDLINNYFKDGDEQSLEILIKRYLKPIYSFVYRYIGDGREAEDITQEVFVKVWKNLRKFKKEKSFKTWIFSIAKNASIDRLRKKKAIPFPDFETVADPAPLPDELLEWPGITQALTAAMGKLSPQYRMVLFLRYNDHFNFREIAEALGESINTIKTRHRRGIAILRKFLKDK